MFFDPEPFDVPEASDFTGTALEVQVAQDSAENVARGLVDPRFTTSRARDEAIAAGRRSVRVEYVANGEGLLEAGTRVYAYVIDRGEEGPPLVIQTSAPSGESLQRGVVDRAARTLRLFRPAGDDGVPAAVERTRAALLRAAEAHDWDALRELVPAEGFTYSFGGPVRGGPIAYWQEREDAGEDPLGTLAAILRLPYTLSTGHYVWPFAYDKPADTLSPYDRRLLGPLAKGYVGESYYGWRAGIQPDGDWAFFVAGD